MEVLKRLQALGAAWGCARCLRPTVSCSRLRSSPRTHLPWTRIQPWYCVSPPTRMRNMFVRSRSRQFGPLTVALNNVIAWAKETPFRIIGRTANLKLWEPTNVVAEATEFHRLHCIFLRVSKGEGDATAALGREHNKRLADLGVGQTHANLRTTIQNDPLLAWNA